MRPPELDEDEGEGDEDRDGMYVHQSHGRQCERGVRLKQICDLWRRKNNNNTCFNCSCI
jgi:hypothetical protein